MFHQDTRTHLEASAPDDGTSSRSPHAVSPDANGLAGPGAGVAGAEARPAREAFVVFDVGGHASALPAASVREILPMAALGRPPGSPAILAGILNLGGEPIPVVRVDALYDLPNIELRAHTPLVVLKTETRPLALLVSSIEAVVEGVPEVEGDLGGGGPERGLRLGERLVPILSMDRLLTDTERERLDHLRAREALRLADLERCEAGEC